MSIDDLLPFGPKKKKKRPYVNKEQVKQLFGKRCLICGKSEKEVGKLIMAHYKAFSKGGTMPIPLCPICHTKYDSGMLTSTQLKKLHLTQNNTGIINQRKRKK